MRAAMIFCGVSLAVTLSVTWFEAQQQRAERELLAAERAYSAALQQGDVTALRQLLAEEFFYSADGNQLASRPSLLSGMRPCLSPEDRSALKNRRLLLEGNVATVEALVDCAAKLNYTATWVRRDERWQIVSEKVQS